MTELEELLLAALQAVAAETNDYVRHYSLDSYLPEHVRNLVNSAIARTKS